MWQEGTVRIGLNIYRFWVKACDEPSDSFGLDGGRIIKLDVWLGDKEVIHYERGWDIRPRTKEAKEVLKTILIGYN